MPVASTFAQVKRFAKRLTIMASLETVAWSGAGSVSHAYSGRGIIFTLHHVRPYQRRPFDPNAHLSITPDFLDQALQVALNAGYVPVALADIPRLLADPAGPRRVFAVTLDDGYRDNVTYAAPVFERHGVPYTIFICEGFTKRTRSMWWEDAEALCRSANAFEIDFGGGQETVECRTVAQKQVAFDRLDHLVHTMDESLAVGRIAAAAKSVGIDPFEIVEREILDAQSLQAFTAGSLGRLGAHTVTHPMLARLPVARVEEEMTRSIDAVERWCGIRPDAFAYPYGFSSACGPREYEIAARLGIQVAVTTRPGVLTTERLAMPTALPRVSLNGHFQKSRYVSALMSGLPFRGQ